MPDLVVTNWFGDVVSHPSVIVDANSIEEIQTALRDPEHYPSPVRAVGSNHSTAPCGVAEKGTLIRMKMNRILNIGADTVTVEAGAHYIDIAKELEERKLQMYVNTEIGSLSAGSAACAGTKDASMPGEYGQVGSYVTGMKMVLPSGELLEVTEDQPDLMQKARSSYGTFGIVYEVTFRIRPLLPMAVHHKTFTVDEFLQKLPELKALGYSMMYYLFPFDKLVTVEFRKYNPGASGNPERHQWKLRNYLWAEEGPRFGRQIEENVPDPALRYKTIDTFGSVWRFKLENLVRGDNTVPTDQIIRYPEVSGDSRYTFSLFAFPEDKYPAVLPAYCQFCQDYYREKGYRINLLSVGYRILKDQQSMLSYSYDGNVITIDPVSTGNPGWHEFLLAYNEFCIERGGVPLPNQTYGVTSEQAHKIFGEKLNVMAETRRHYDPEDRLLNEYMRGWFGTPQAATSTGAR